MPQKNLFLFLILAFVSHSATAQQNNHLGLQEAISAATADNNAVKTASLDEQIATAKFRQTDAIFLPQANFSYAAFNTNNPLTSFGFKLQQKTIAVSDFNPSSLNDPRATSDFTTKFEVQQPLLNVDMLYQRKGAARQIEMYQLISHRTKEYLAYQTENAYLQLQMLYNSSRVLKEALATSKAARKTSQDYFAQGLIQKSDLLNANVHVMDIETQLTNTQSNIEDVSDMLSLLMNKLTGTIYTTDSLHINTSMSLDSLQLPDDRADFKALKKSMEGYDMMIKSSKMSYLPRLNAFASYQLNDKAMFGFDSDTYFAGIQLTWNVFNGTRRKYVIDQQSLEKDKLAQQLEQQKSEARLQINNARRQLSNAAFSIKKQEVAIEQASEALRVIENRYTQGLVKTTDVLMAQTQLSQQKLGYVQAVFNYNLAVANLRFLTNIR